MQKVNVLAASVDNTVLNEKLTTNIQNLETIKMTGTKESNISITIDEKKDQKTVEIHTDSTINYKNGLSKDEQVTSVITLDNNKVVSVDGVEVNQALNDQTYHISQNELSILKEFAQQYENGEISYDKYLELIKNSNITPKPKNLMAMATSGGLSYVTWYKKNSYSGGYDIRAALFNGYWNSGLNSLMLDAKAVKSGTMLYRHNYLVGNMAAFQIRADNISTAKTVLGWEAAALMGSLGLAVLTVSTIIGAAAAGGSAAVSAGLMINTSKSAHNDVKKAYELAKTIKNVSPM